MNLSFLKKKRKSFEFQLKENKHWYAKKVEVGKAFKSI